MSSVASRPKLYGRFMEDTRNSGSIGGANRCHSGVMVRCDPISDFDGYWNNVAEGTVASFKLPMRENSVSAN